MNQRNESDAGWQARVEAAFERWGRFVIRHRVVALVSSLLVTGWLFSYLPGLVIDNSTESFLLPDDPAVVAYNASRDQFGRDDRILVAVSAPDLFAPEFLERLRAFHDAIEVEVPHVERVESLFNARVTRGDDAGLIVEDLLEQWPVASEELARIRDFAFSNPLYENALISSDRGLTAIAITPSTYSASEGPGDLLGGFEEEGDRVEGQGPGGGARPPAYLSAVETEAVMVALLGLAERFERDDFQIHVAGAIPMTHRINVGMVQDLSMMMPITLLLMSIVLALLFRRLGGVVLPLAIVVLSLMATIGMMIFLGMPGSTAVQILPVFLLTVGVCDAVHILALAYRYRMEGRSKEDSIAKAMGHAGLAVLMTSVTTAAGMASFVTAEMAAVRHLGILAPIGIALAFAYTMVLLPALLAIFPLPVPKRGNLARGHFPFESFLVGAGRFASRHPIRVLLPTFLLLIIGVLGALQVRFSHNGLSWFPEDDDHVVAMKVIDERLRGSVTLDLIVDTGEAGGLYEPATLRAIDGLIREIGILPVEPLFIGKSLSVLDILKETHLALNENRPEMRRIPETRALIAQELLLFENSGSDDTEEFVDSEYRRARISMRIPFEDALLFPKLLADIRMAADERLDGFATYQLTGLMTLLAEIFDNVIQSMIRSYVFALSVITPLMMLLVGSLRRGLVSMIPNLLPVIAVLGVVGWAGIALDTTTMMVGAMVIGIAVDDTIHFMHKFQRYFELTGNVEEAVCETLRTTGSALLFTTLVLMVGFGVFLLGGMTNMRIFGGLAAMATGVAFLADLLVAPALLTLVEATRTRPVNEAQPA